MTPTPQDALLNEFISYYNSDELELFIHDNLEEQADESAERMVHILGDRAVEVASLMREMAADPAHPFYRTICKRTMYDWDEDQDSWAKFQQLAQRVSDGITKATSG
ncbi:hypothetical protein DL991_21160 [Amycolatopsis sp. WAC 01375]|uniref:hypothetical protein n=1 Tax=unclassified Amycolatopsis TaxID=2618356 RepID=UPI000F799AFF|nr:MULTISPECIES: hypothetical protein [unclassified Amycolatopsis]RSM77062.1 hypothetical protein DL991_21160 [Amycolatopsis sp. WAC 01375]RSN23614.1 hypothetical protein DL990_34920 [Amycolatopsis sp. WAC 01416]